MKTISKLATELNVSANTIIQQLKEVSDREFDLNSKLDLKELDFLNAFFCKDKQEKIRVDKKRATFHFDIDEFFSFSLKEKRDLSDLFSEYQEKLRDIEQLKKKENRFWALETEEIELLLKSKFKRIYEIQKSVKVQRELRNIAISDSSNTASNPDPYEKFRFGGLRGEEAHTAYWNCH